MLLHQYFDKNLTLIMFTALINKSTEKNDYPDPKIMNTDFEQAANPTNPSTKVYGTTVADTLALLVR